MDGNPRLGLGYSTCPNDTFMFHALVHGLVPDCGLSFDVTLDDIEGLNVRALGELPNTPQLAVTKVSAGVLPWITDRYTVLQSGAALGRGCGPLVVSLEPRPLAELSGKRVAIPGERTTAYLLLRLFSPPDIVPVPMRFDRIVAAVAGGAVDAGLIIHESRFTYGTQGLSAIADLGQLWERETGLPLPLGVIVAQRTLGPTVLERLEHALCTSVRLAFDQPSLSHAYIRAHAQEMSDEVCRQHIALYVNAFSVQLGAEGRAAIDALLARGVKTGALPLEGASPWR